MTMWWRYDGVLKNGGGGGDDDEDLTVLQRSWNMEIIRDGQSEANEVSKFCNHET